MYIISIYLLEKTIYTAVAHTTAVIHQMEKPHTSRRFLARTIVTTLLIAVITVSPLGSGCIGNKDSSTQEHAMKLQVTGSTTVLPIAEECACVFMKNNPGSQICVSGSGSSHGVKAAADGTINIGDASRDMLDSERASHPGLVTHAIAKDGVAIVVHPESPVNGLTMQELKSRHVGTSKEIVETMARLEDVFLTHHFAHVRCEISGDLKDVFEAIVSPLVKLVSLMDHTPGQGQFTDHTRYREYHKRIYGLNDDEIDRIVRKKSGYADELLQNMREVAEFANARGISIASHDDDSPEKVELVHSIGARISEFPITLDAARKGRELGMIISMGAPNVVLGRSTSGNLSSSEAIDAGLVDLLCSDYNPGSMLYSAFILWKRGVLTLSDAVNMITRNPAEVVGMGGTIGSIEIGERADLLVVSKRMELPIVACTIVDGRSCMRQAV
ncbi:MAG: hypothetical protein C4B59_00255 [Candidatus Methanogaster sp.]|uniref:Uncharacterized protein n=1 Tax=Candidatus Methanogaster sp. TaxID=3386292 RepID=A0AC61L6M7_9EURY|nr:MAG: hypothetical protein C4B59_00255 [ANME-2 cluster archaeon]